MSLQKEDFGTLPDGRSVARYQLVGPDGLSVAVLTYGSILQALCFAGRDLVLGYDTLEGYLRDRSNQGASIGRYGNRIADGVFVLNGQSYLLTRNENGVTHLHGGQQGFGRRLWQAEILSEAKPSLRLSLFSPDGEEGYPGNLTASVTYSLPGDGALHILYEASCDQDTHYNPTCHAYFRLGDIDAREHILQLCAAQYLPVDSRLIPTGERRSVEGTPFDFRTAKPIGQDIAAADPQLALVGHGYDHTFVLSGDKYASLYAPDTGIRMDCYTDQPGIQLYTSNFLDEADGKGGILLRRYGGVCLETQHFPDTPHRPEFPSTLLPAGAPYRSETIYRFHR